MPQHQCIDCLRAGQREKAPEKLAKEGLAVCALERAKGRFVSLSFSRECEHFSPVPDAVAKARREWLEAQR